VAGSTDHPQEAVGLLLREVLDLHAAMGGGDDHDPLGFPVEHEAEIDLLRDVGGLLDPER
jgi:hypothetical protein